MHKSTIQFMHEKHNQYSKSLPKIVTFCFIEILSLYCGHIGVLELVSH